MQFEWLNVMMRIVIAAILIILPSPAMADTINNSVEYRFNFESDDGSYIFEIINYGISGNKYDINHIKISKREIHIECLSKCTCRGAYEEGIGQGSGWPSGSGILGIFQVQDESRHLVTTWAASTSYNIKIYGCEGGKLKRVAAINSRTSPVVIPDQNGMPVIEYSPDYDNPEAKETLYWNGKIYKLKSRN